MYKQLLNVFFGLTSCGLTCTVCVWNQWATTGQGASPLLGPIWMFNGIWEECTQYMGGQYQCDDWQVSFMDLPSYLLVIRGMMSVSMALTILACILLPPAMQCSRLLDDSTNLKRKIVLFCAVCYGVSGILTLSSLAWYTQMLVWQFRTTDETDIVRYEPGAALYLGYIGVVFSFLAAISCVCNPGPKDEAASGDDYKYDRGVGTLLPAATGVYQPKSNNNKHMEYV